jgi:hypothetical protein
MTCCVTVSPQAAEYLERRVREGGGVMRVDGRLAAECPELAALFEGMTMVWLDDVGGGLPRSRLN